MRKQELVHLHALCTLLREHVEARADDSADAFVRYDDLDVSPAAIYRGKGAHRRAVRLLAADVAAAVAEDPSQAPASPVTDGGTPDGPDERR